MIVELRSRNDTGLCIHKYANVAFWLCKQPWRSPTLHVVNAVHASVTIANCNTFESRACTAMQVRPKEERPLGYR